MSSEKKRAILVLFNIVFHVSLSSFCFLWFNKSLKDFTYCFTSTHHLSSFCLYFDSRRIHEIHSFFPVNFLLQFMTCSSLTPRRWFTEALRCINDLVHSEFPISALPCCSVFIMISSDLSYRDRIMFTGKWWFFTFLDREKCSTFLHQRHLRYK